MAIKTSITIFGSASKRNVVTLITSMPNTAIFATNPENDRGSWLPKHARNLGGNFVHRAQTIDTLQITLCVVVAEKR